ncbi:MAG TPA: hypothetical protein PLV15_07880, partial [Smithella sp.]|nr:hypothetical protein [Smithella sp.]
MMRLQNRLYFCGQFFGYLNRPEVSKMHHVRAKTARNIRHQVLTFYQIEIIQRRSFHCVPKQFAVQV